MTAPGNGRPVKPARLLPALALPLALLLSACHPSPGAAGGAGGDSDGKGSVTLHVGDQKGNSEAVLRAAGELKNLPYRIRWSTFTSGPPLLEAVNAGAVDIGAVGDTPPVFAGAAGSRIRVVGASRSSAAGEAVVVKKGSGLHGPADLRGHTVAVAQGSSAHYMLLASLARAGLSTKDVRVTYLQPADALAAFSRGKVDAWATWDPYTSQALGSGARVLTTGQGVVDGLSFQVAAPAALSDDGRGAAVRDYLTRLRRAQAWVHRHPRTWAEVWSRETGLPQDVALAAVHRTRGTAVAVAVDDAAVDSEQRIVTTFARLRLIPHSFDFAVIVDDRYNQGLPPSGTAPLRYRKGE
ncbi:ABC transporter substrate-binding protein [Streptomyces sp. NPDC059740]|uniref:ABC transporter substrate-binding protein n=1 Tax=Streptomyces sp. NPDC059740 TaxID=3346926 RepID=UPI00365C3B6C